MRVLGGDAQCPRPFAVDQRRAAWGRENKPAFPESQVDQLVALAACLPEHVLADDPAVARTHLDIHRDVRRSHLHKGMAGVRDAQLAVEAARIQPGDTSRGEQVARAIEQNAAR